MTNQEIKERLLAAADVKFAAFNGRIVPDGNLPMLGVKTPIVEKLAGEVFAARGDEYEKDPSKGSFEENLLLGFVIAKSKRPLYDYIEGIKSYLPNIDNWAACDLFTSRLKRVKKNPREFLDAFENLKDSAAVYERRFLAVLLLDFYISDEYLDELFSLYKEIKEGDYYVDMALAWGLSVCLVKFYDRTLPHLSDPAFSDFTVNKAIQKARESYRISDERKRELLSYKRK